jgi:hypothetical protein
VIEKSVRVVGTGAVSELTGRVSENGEYIDIWGCEVTLSLANWNRFKSEIDELIEEHTSDEQD